MDKVLLQSRTDKGNYSKASGYQEIAVLMLCWDQRSDAFNAQDEIDQEEIDQEEIDQEKIAQEEIDTLKKVFQDQFGYSVTISKLSPPAKGVLRVEAKKQVANFVSDHDGQHNLLIVYYAGHGKPGESYGDLVPFRSVLQIDLFPQV